MLEKTYNPQALEEKIYAIWEQNQSFEIGRDDSKPAYTILMPPPNVTGNLHMGHALTFTLQDILIRYKRMQGYNTLWQPGLDHAGISTQMVVERLLASQSIHKTDLGREEFIKRTWAWKEEYGGAILKQQRRLGFSPDWSRERFTMDPHACQGVVNVFVQLYRDGLIYKDQRLVNWDPKFLTALSDLEVSNEETQGTLYYIHYPIKDRREFISVATTRPETLFGDQAVAVHPDDTRYQHLIGQYVQLPLTDRLIPIIADTYTDPEKGTGAVKITPAHDFNDFEVGKRHQLKPLNIFDTHACLNREVPLPYQGLDRFVARKKVLEALRVENLLFKEEKIVHHLPYGDRSHTILEPRLTEQWYVDAHTLAQPALEAVRSGKTKFIPENWSNTYFQWLENIQPWCISRQLWWGHRIPAWYGPDGQFFVAHNEDEAHALAHQHYGQAVPLSQDDDVLDTWFSSALWPFLTLGWPEETPQLKNHFPSSVLITGLDIIFFWVARMMMMSLYFMKEVPFRTVFLHALVRDEKGQKMSKTKGNVIDPLDLVEKYGADAVRFAVASLTTPGRDVKFSENLVETYRNFATKLWNASRFCTHNNCAYDPTFDPHSTKLALNRWFISALTQAVQELEKALERYRFDEATSLIYQFIWGQFCDWYIELSKPILYGEDLLPKEETQKTLAWALGQICHILHPFMPHLTEALWSSLTQGLKLPLLISSPWPLSAHSSFQAFSDPTSTTEINWLIEFISAIRSIRSELNLAPNAPLPLYFMDANSQTIHTLLRYQDVLQRLAHVQYQEGLPPRTLKSPLQGIIQEATFILATEGIIDCDQEKKRMETEIQALEQEIKLVLIKLDNPEFTAKAPAHIIEKNQCRVQEARHKQEKLLQALKRFGA